MKNGRDIGNNFENAVCRILASWVLPEGTVTDKTPLAQLPFRRRSTALMPTDGHWDGEGDILARPDIRFPWAVECKRDSKFGFDGLATQAKPPLLAHVAQANAQAKRAGKDMMLFVTRPRFPVFLLANWDTMRGRVHLKRDAFIRFPSPSGVYTLIDTSHVDYLSWN